MEVEEDGPNNEINPLAMTIEYKYDGRPITDLEEFLANFDEIFSDIEVLTFDGRILQARDAAQTLDSSLKIHSENTSQLPQKQQELLTDCKRQFQDRYPLFKQIIRESKAIHNLLDEFSKVNQGDPKWEVLLQTPHFTTSFQTIPNSNYQKYLFNGHVPAPISSVLPMIIEVDFYTDWVPSVSGKLGLRSSKEVGFIDRFRRLASLLFGFWPLDDRECLVSAFGVELFEQNQILVVMENCWQHSHFKIPKQADITIDLLYGGILLQPTPNDHTTVQVIYTFDPKLSFVHDKLVQWMVKFFSPSLYENFVKTAVAISKNQNQKFLKRMDERKDVYHHLELRRKVHRDWLNEKNSNKNNNKYL